MIEGICIEKDKRIKGKTYCLIETMEGKKALISKDSVKQSMREKKLYLDNLKLTKGGRLLSVESNTNVKKIMNILLKARMIGLNVEAIETLSGHIYVVSHNSGNTTVYIPDYISDFSAYFFTYSSCIINIRGNLKVVGGKNIRDMSHMFEYLRVNSLDLTEFSTESAESMFKMFCEAEIPKIDLSKFNTSNVKSMGSMFNNCKTEVIDINSFDIGKVTNMNDMFSRTKAKIRLNNICIKYVGTLDRMFYKCCTDELDLRNFGDTYATRMLSMFEGCRANIINVSNLNFRQITLIEDMFKNCHADHIIVNKQFSKFLELTQLSKCNNVEFKGEE